MSKCTICLKSVTEASTNFCDKCNNDMINKTMTPLHLICTYDRDSASIKQFVDNWDLMSLDNHGNLPLHHYTGTTRTVNDYIDVIKHMTNGNMITLKMKNSKGKRPLDNIFGSVHINTPEFNEFLKYLARSGITLDHSNLCSVCSNKNVTIELLRFMFSLIAGNVKELFALICANPNATLELIEYVGSYIKYEFTKEEVVEHSALHAICNNPNITVEKLKYVRGIDPHVFVAYGTTYSEFDAYLKHDCLSTLCANPKVTIELLDILNPPYYYYCYRLPFYNALCTICCRKGANIEIIKWLLQRDTLLNPPSHVEKSVLDYCIQLPASNREVFMLLVGRGARFKSVKSITDIKFCEVPPIEFLMYLVKSYVIRPRRMIEVICNHPQLTLESLQESLKCLNITKPTRFPLLGKLRDKKLQNEVDNGMINLSKNSKVTLDMIKCMMNVDANIHGNGVLANLFDSKKEDIIEFCRGLKK